MERARALSSKPCLLEPCGLTVGDLPNPRNRQGGNEHFREIAQDEGRESLLQNIAPADDASEPQQARHIDQHETYIGCQYRFRPLSAPSVIGQPTHGSRCKHIAQEIATRRAHHIGDPQAALRRSGEYRQIGRTLNEVQKHGRQP